MTTKKKNNKSNNAKAAAQRVQARNAGQGKRWGFSLGNASYGPVSIKDLKFGSDKAMGAPKRSLGIAESTRQLQRVMPRLRSSHRDGGVQVDVLEGTDMIATVSSAEGGTLAGDILLKLAINPMSFANTRLRQYAPLYQRYRFTRIRFRYQPIANNLQTGQLLGFCDFDVENQLAGNDPLNLQRGAAHQGQKVVKISESEDFDMGQANTYTDLYTNTDGVEPRLSYQGVFYLLASSDIAADLPLGNIYIDYVCEFTIPQLSEPKQFTACSYHFQAGLWSNGTEAHVVFKDPLPDTAPGSLTAAVGGTSRVIGASTYFQEIHLQCIPGSNIYILGHYDSNVMSGTAENQFGTIGAAISEGLTGITGDAEVCVSTTPGPSRQARMHYTVKAEVSESLVKLKFPWSSAFLPADMYTGQSQLMVIQVPPPPEITSTARQVKVLKNQLRDQQIMMHRMMEQMEGLLAGREPSVPLKRRRADSWEDLGEKESPESPAHTAGSVSQKQNGTPLGQPRRTTGGYAI